MKPVISRSSVVALLFLELLALAAINICLCNGSTDVGCIESERRALLRLKKDLIDPSNRLASWNGDGGDCCNWAGVVCHNFTSHVLELHLGNPHPIPYNLYITSSDLYQSEMVRDAEDEAFWRSELMGSLPTISSSSVLDLSNNAFSGSIFQFLCSRMNESKFLGVLNLRNNSLSGRLPNCWMSWSELEILNLANNEFTGSLPTSMGTLRYLVSLHLGKNSFSGMIPMSLKNCTRLEALDIGGNEFVGNIPTWIGETFSSMRILSFHSNKFHGFLPVELCYLAFLQILDLSHNNIYGPIPRCIGNFSAMGSMEYFGENSISYLSYVYSHFENKRFIEEASLVMKGTAADYNTILNLVRYIDLSHNNFSGEIPTEVTSLVALQSLNLSHNSFTGRIPPSIGAMRALESIDLSANQFDGEIPQSISNLTFLSFLNFSNNNLIGKIPSSTQLQSFDASSFTGNELCGPPLPKNCTEIVPSTPGSETENEDEVDWLFYVSIAVGFIVGFWSVIGSLLVNRRWRYMYCHFLDRLRDKLRNVVRKCC